MRPIVNMHSSMQSVALEINVQVNVALQLESYTFSENDAGAEVCILVQSGSVQSGQTFTAGYGSFGITASELMHASYLLGVKINYYLREFLCHNFAFQSTHSTSLTKHTHTQLLS